MIERPLRRQKIACTPITETVILVRDSRAGWGLVIVACAAYHETRRRRASETIWMMLRTGERANDTRGQRVEFHEILRVFAWVSHQMR